MIGTHIGNYRIVTELGAGAMGEVYFAEHTVMGRRAAVKVIRQELSSNEDMVQRFINEARQVNRIGHPNIVEITDFGQVADRYYMMMELLEGETLEERLERVRTLSERETVEIAVQVAAALSAAHELGVVHRDLKPENIYLVKKPGDRDFVKVLDFGIAKLTLGEAKPDAGTVPGTILGTPHYMSPEQCRGELQLDHRSDIYSLGIVLYRALTGVFPFDGESIFRVLYAHSNDSARPPRELRPELSTAVESVIVRAMAKDKEQRFASMQALRAALEEALNLPRVRALVPVAEIAAESGATPSQPTLKIDAEQQQRVGSRLARILIERIHHDKLLLPSMPQVATECIQMLDDPDGGMMKVAAAIGRDPIIAPQILRRARSAALGGGDRVRTIEHAVARLGVRQLRALLIELSARRLFESRDPAIRRATRDLWEHSVAVAIVARGIARRRRGIDADVAYLAGLLHDVGKPVAAALLLEAERTSASPETEWLGSDAWLAIIDECHREVGVAMARSWGLPEDVWLAMARCDRYSAEGANAPSNAVCFANALVKREGIYHGAFDAQQVDALINEGTQLYRIEGAMLESLITELKTQGDEGVVASS